MKKLFTAMLFCLFGHLSFGQTIKLNTYSKKQEVQITSGDYILSFSAKDIHEAYKLLNTNTQKKYDITKLKTGQDYNVSEKENIKELIDNEIGAYLILKGKVYIEHTPHVRINEINAEEGPVMADMDGTKRTPYSFTDSKTNSEVYVCSVNSSVQ